MATQSQHPASFDQAPARPEVRPRRRPLPLVAAAVTLLALAAAGCGGGAGTAASASDAPSSPPAAGSAAPSADATGTAGTSGGGSGPTPSAVAPAGSPTTAARTASSRCLAADLGLSLGRGDPGAGNVYYPLRFTNKSTHACTLNGFPGVSLLKGDGSALGKPAAREGGSAAAVQLAPGRTVEADLHTLNRGVKGDSCWAAPALLKVYPPGSTDAMTLRTAQPVVCGATFTVSPIRSTAR